MKVLWALAAAACGVLGAIGPFKAISAFVRRPEMPPHFGIVLMLGFGLAMLFGSWRMALRARQAFFPMSGPPPSVSPRRRLVISIALAIMVSFVGFAGGFVLAAAGRDSGLLYWSVVSLGQGIPFAAMALRLGPGGYLGLIMVQALQLALLAAAFYLIGSWWASRRARRRLPP